MDEATQKKLDDYKDRMSLMNAGLTESPGIAFCTVYMDGLPVNLTSRSTTPYEAIASLKMSIKLAKELLGVTLEKEIPSAPQVDPVDKAFPPSNEPVYEDIEPKHTFTVKSLAHSKTQSGKDVIKVFLVEDYKFGNKKYGITAFGGGPDGWERWAENAQYAPPEGFGHVVVSDPKDGGKYANVLSFQK